MDISEASFRRRSAIEEELLAMMQEVPFDRITVLDIAQRQGIARKTFYRYFPNKQACLEGLLDRVIYECSIGMLRHSEQVVRERQQYEAWLLFWRNHQSLLEVLIRNRLDHLLVDRLADYTLREDAYVLEHLTTDRMECDEDILYFYLAGQVKLLLRWAEEGFSRPMEEMVDKLMRLIQEPLFGSGK